MLAIRRGVKAAIAAKRVVAQALASPAVAGLRPDRTRVTALTTVIHVERDVDATIVADQLTFVGAHEFRLVVVLVIRLVVGHRVVVRCPIVGLTVGVVRASQRKYK